MATAKKTTAKPKTSFATVEGADPTLQTRAKRLEAGRALRTAVPRTSHAGWKAPGRGRDPVAILEESSKGRVPELIPLRYGRMLRSPFTFLRGSAGLMAHDLATTPNTGLRVQACGDCHLLNFGLFATPERNLVFDLNDFDETLPAPWEWDLKRLVTSFVIAARDSRMNESAARETVLAGARAYREHLREYSRMSPLEVWYKRLNMEELIAMSPDEKARKVRRQLADKARQRVVENLFPTITGDVAGGRRIVDQPPVLFHVGERGFEERSRQFVADYRNSLPEDRRVLLDRYRLEDAALKVVGIGSVGTRCFIGLFFDEENHPLLLQFKEAGRSVLEPYAGKSHFENQGQRIVIGQRLMQSSSDIFLGWAKATGGGHRDFFVRQLRDMKMSVPIEKLAPVHLTRYAEFCGWTLARAHAKSGDAATISGYLGKGDIFDKALVEFALAYADQTEKDHAALVKAVQAGRVQATMEE